MNEITIGQCHGELKSKFKLLHQHSTVHTITFDASIDAIFHLIHMFDFFILHILFLKRNLMCDFLDRKLAHTRSLLA